MSSVKLRRAPRVAVAGSEGKQRVNLTVRADAIRYAREAGLNLSQMLENALMQKQREAAAQRWQEENREAIEYHRRRIERDGMLNKDLISF